MYKIKLPKDHIQTMLFVSIFLFSLSRIAAQTFPDSYTYLESDGVIPEDIIRIAEAKNSTYGNIFLRELFFSGSIIYGSPVNEYLNTIADNLLRDYPTLREKIRIYVNKSTQVNAYATDEGIILVNLGLIAQVSNESELAFIIAHEIAHYAEKHVYHLRDYKEKNKSKNVKIDYLNYHNRSRETELAADKIALEKYYKDSPYSFKVLDGVFDVLQYHYLPFDEIPFIRSYVETSFYMFPDNYFLENLNPIRNREDYIDTLSTHPNLKKRREYAAQVVSTQSETGRSVFVQSEELFFHIRNMARFECINMFLTNHQYGDAIYNIFILQQDFPDNQFLETAMASALYGLYKHKQYGNLNEVLENYRNIEGEKQQVHFLFNKFNRQELNVLSLRFAWTAYLKYPDNNYIYNLCLDLGKEMISRNKMNLTLFSDYPMGTDIEDIVEEIIEPDTSANTSKNKYQRIREQNVSQSAKVKPNEKFRPVNYMLVDLKQDSAFVAMLHKVTIALEDEHVLSLIKDNTLVFRSDSLIVASPYYGKTYRNYSSKKAEKRRKNFQNEKDQLTKAIDYSLRKLKIENRFYSEKNIVNFTTEEYNQYCRIQSWLIDFLHSKSDKMILYQKALADNLIDRIGYDKLNFVLIHTSPASFVTFQKVWNVAFYSPIFLMSIPASLFAFSLPRYEMRMAFYVIDMETGEVLMHHSDKVTSEMRQSYINRFVYESYYKVKKGK